MLFSYITTGFIGRAIDKLLRFGRGIAFKSPPFSDYSHHPHYFSFRNASPPSVRSSPRGIGGGPRIRVSNFAQPDAPRDIALDIPERCKLERVGRVGEVADARDVDARGTKVVFCAVGVSKRWDQRIRTNARDGRSRARRAGNEVGNWISGRWGVGSGVKHLLAPRFANPSSSSSPHTHVFGLSSGMTSPYVLSASRVRPRNTLPSTRTLFSEREWTAWYRKSRYRLLYTCCRPKRPAGPRVPTLRQ